MSTSVGTLCPLLYNLSLIYTRNPLSFDLVLLNLLTASILSFTIPMSLILTSNAF